MEAAGVTADFAAEQIIFVYHRDMLYPAQIIKVDDHESAKPRYYIHYVGWEDKWNEWVEASRMLPYTPENEARRMELRRQKIKAPTEAVTMPEVLDKELYLEEEASARLEEKWGDEDCCTYQKGYTTQHIYACKECSLAAQKQFGFCYGCSMKCHVDHTVFELFEKRHFRCDCGTPRSNFICQFQLEPPPADNQSQNSSNNSPSESIVADELDRSSDNTENCYNHNFDGVYCWCEREYDHDGDDTMYQCARCQDWFHDKCIQERTQGNTIPDEDDFSEFFCASCMTACPYLLQYPHLRVYGPGAVQKKEEGEKQEEEKTDGADRGVKRKRDTSDDAGPEKVKEETEDGEKEAKQEQQQCKLDASDGKAPLDNAFWCAEWRDALCTCPACMELYAQTGCGFLMEDAPDDDADEGELHEDADEEKEGKTKSKKGVSLLSASEEAFTSSIGKSQQRDLALGYQAMMEGLRDHLRPFAESGREVTKEDIQNIFGQLNQKRRRRD